jgi:hypothetical protein
LSVAASAGASTSSAGAAGSATAHDTPVVHLVPRARPAGTVTFGRGSHGRLSFTSILKSGDVVTGVRGTTNGNVILTGGMATGNGTQNDPFLYQGALSAAAGPR